MRTPSVNPFLYVVDYASHCLMDISEPKRALTAEVGVADLDPFLSAPPYFCKRPLDHWEELISGISNSFFTVFFIHYSRI